MNSTTEDQNKGCRRFFIYGSALIAMMALNIVSAGPNEDYKAGHEAFLAEDLITAMQLLEKASDEGHLDAKSLLAYIYHKSEMNEKAFKLYTEAAEGGNAQGALGLGAMYISGEGSGKNIDKGLHWITTAAENNYGPAIMVLSEAYLKGDIGLTPDRNKAIEWLNKGIALGYEPAQLRLDVVTKQNKSNEQLTEEAKRENENALK